MKKNLMLILSALILCACAGVSTTDGDSTKQWVVLSSSKADMDGDVYDVCFRLKLRFNPSEVTQRFDTDRACITKCCWYSENKTVEIRFNDGFVDEFAKNGKARKYDTDSMKIYLRYSPFLKTIHAKADPSSIIRSDGLVTLTYDEVQDEKRLLKVGTEEVKAQDFEGATAASNKGEYLFRRNSEGTLLVNHTAAMKAREEAQRQAAEPENPQGANVDETAEREALLAKKLAYERRQAVLLLRRFYNKDIDAYIMNIDKAQKKKGLVLLANDRKWATTKIGSPIYRVTCKVNGQLGKTKADMKDYPIQCGVYEVNLDEQTVEPMDTVATAIVSREYTAAF